MFSAKLVPELMVSNYDASRDFYVSILGFAVLYDRPAEKFAYLDLDGAQLMIEQETDFWATAPREQPYGRGINLQIEVTALEPVIGRLQAAGVRLFRPVEEAWYRAGVEYSGNRQFLVQDPDGYLLRIYEDLGFQAAPTKGRIVG